MVLFVMLHCLSEVQVEISAQGFKITVWVWSVWCSGLSACRIQTSGVLAGRVCAEAGHISWVWGFGALRDFKDRCKVAGILEQTVLRYWVEEFGCFWYTEH